MLILEQKVQQLNIPIPSNIVFEEIDGVALPFKGYKEVLNGNLKPEDIMGSSSIQAAIVYAIGIFIGNNLDRKKYTIVSNEAGLRLDKENNFSNDLAIFHKNVKLNRHYFNIAPILAIEVDIKADINESPFATNEDYIITKSQKMLDFGTQQVIWILTQSKKIFIVSNDGPWKIVGFDYDISLLENCVLNMKTLLLNEEITI